jgi:hypothetical protein
LGCGSYRLLGSGLAPVAVVVLMVVLLLLLIVEPLLTAMQTKNECNNQQD